MLQEANEFLAGLERSELMIQRCQKCSQYIFYPRAHCPHDLGDLTYEKVSGKGKILSYTVVMRSGEPTLSELTPYIAAIIELDEGAKIFSRVVDIDPDKVQFNQRVKALFIKQDEQVLPVFTPV